MERIRTELELFGKAPDMRERYQRLQEAEGKAREVLITYERHLLEQLAGSSEGPPPA
jgi:hypothetical protein